MVPQGEIAEPAHAAEDTANPPRSELVSSAGKLRRADVGAKCETLRP